VARSSRLAAEALPPHRWPVRTLLKRSVRARSRPCHSPSARSFLCLSESTDLHGSRPAGSNQSSRCVKTNCADRRHARTGGTPAERPVARDSIAAWSRCLPQEAASCADLAWRRLLGARRLLPESTP
jgi:hypothetical protein